MLSAGEVWKTGEHKVEKINTLSLKLSLSLDGGEEGQDMVSPSSPACHGALFQAGLKLVDLPVSASQVWD